MLPPPSCIPLPPHTLSCPHLNAFRLLAECVGIVEEPHHHVASTLLYTPPSPHSIMCPPLPSPPSLPTTLSCPHLNTFRLLAECVGVVEESHNHVSSTSLPTSPLYTPLPSPPLSPPLPTLYHALTLTPSVSLQSV